MSGLLTAFVVAATPLATPADTSTAQPAPTFSMVAQSASAATSTDDDLGCAMWASYRLGSLPANADPNVRLGLAAAVSWFIGLYEGKTGTEVGSALKALLQKSSDADITALEPGCRNRMKGFGQRLVDFAK